MRYRQLGATGLCVSEIGFGGWGIGGDVNGSISYGPSDDQDSMFALQQAFDLGVTFFDVSDFYGMGHSEELVGRALKDVRAKVVIATKAGFKDIQGAQDFSSAHIRSSIEGSLKRLETDYVDLYQLHSPSIDALKSEPLVETLEALKTEGKIRSYGISLRSPDDGILAINEFGFNCIQVNFNLVDQRTRENGLLSLCCEKDVGVIIRTPLCFGFLSGYYKPDEEFHPMDHRKSWSREQIQRWTEANDLFSKVGIRDKRETPAQFALRFCLSHSGVSTVIPGMLSRSQVEENLRASTLGNLPKDELKEIWSIYQQHQFFVEKKKDFVGSSSVAAKFQ